MSRARHKEHHKKEHRAEGGEVGEHRVGNPNVYKLAEGKGHAVHGAESNGHLGRARGGKIKAHKRASGGKVATKGSYSSAKLATGGGTGAHVGDHRFLGADAKVKKDGVPKHHRGRD